VVTCAACGRASPDDFEFCPGCGAPLAPPERRETRKVVTILFCDLTGSTSLGERTDPEALRTLMNRYYEAARVVLERHGGTVEKFIGDAVMAVFGIPSASEDDALRAARAAVELRTAVGELGLEARIGVNTGAVVAGEGDTLVTGDAVNVAARLEQTAGAGEIVLGDATATLIRDAVETEAVELVLAGKSGDVTAHRLLSLDPAAAGVERRLDRPLVGRGRERERLRSDFDDAVAARTGRLFTLIGPAGVGKSRLVADFLEHIGGMAVIARGRALSYGDGITYWPLVEVLLQLGVDPAEVIRASAADTQLTTRALLERIAERRPLVIVLDDLHWAEPPLLDLVEHLADWSREAPIFLVCVARPELLDVRPGWGGGKLNATSVLLEPLGATEADALATELLAGVGVDDETRRTILDTAEGNPLFLEEMAALARSARGPVEVPPTIQAVLQARLDSLDADERTVIERGAVEGKVFHRGAVTALATDALRDEVPGRLVTLVRKELVRPERAQIPGDDAFRFRHLLIRDTAYESLPKAARAELHERFADWLAGHPRLFEQDEILGYHIEQAVRYRLELDPSDPLAPALGERAAAHLGIAGHAAFARGDVHATRRLLGRAMELLPEGPGRRSLIPEFADALFEDGLWETYGTLLEELARGSDHDRAIGVVLAIRRNPAGDVDELLQRLDDAQRVLEDGDDPVAVARCEHARALVFWTACRMGEAQLAYRRAYDLLRNADLDVVRRHLVAVLVRSAAFGGRSIDEIRALLDELSHEAGASGPLLAASLRSNRAQAEYLAGSIELEELRAESQPEIELLEQVGSPFPGSSAGFLDQVVPMLAGDTVAVERRLREDVETYERLGASMYLAFAMGSWALALCELDDPAAALDAVARGRELAEPDDLADHVVLDLGEAYARAIGGEIERAHALVTRARQTARGTDMQDLTNRIELIDARVRLLAGDTDGAERLLKGLVERHESLGFERFAERFRRELAGLG
jgi:class 3 adenylate cyclase